MTRRYIAMVPMAVMCTACDGSGWIGHPYAAGSAERSAWSLGDCAACEGKGNVIGDQQPIADLYSECDFAKSAPYGGATSVLAVDIDDLERVDPPESDEERYMRCERIAQAAWAEVERLRPVVEHGLAPRPPTLHAWDGYAGGFWEAIRKIEQHEDTEGDHAVLCEVLELASAAKRGTP